jgi:hypothetical protein
MGLIAALKCLRENLCRPSGTPSASHFTQDLRPGLTYRAPLRAAVLQIQFREFHPKSSSHAYTKALRRPKPDFFRSLVRNMRPPHALGDLVGAFEQRQQNL